MRTLSTFALAATVLVTGCGQKGPLLKPTRTPTSPVVIHAPTAPPAEPVPPVTPQR